MHVFLDDSGDAGMKLDSGSSSHLVMAACIFETTLAIDRAASAISQCRTTMGKGARWEFKHAKSSEHIRDAFFDAVEHCDFVVRAIVIDKKALRSDHLRSVPNDLKNFAVMQLLTHTDGYVTDAKLVIDGKDGSAFGVTDSGYFRRRINEQVAGTIRKVRHVDSGSDLLIQLADMVAGTIRRDMSDPTQGSRRRMRIVARKAVGPKGDIWCFR